MKKPSNKLLLIIDAQYDFINGSLAVEGAPEKMDALAQFINDTKAGTYKNVVMTADFHPHDHSSFTAFGGQWPAHCIQFSHGGAIYEPILNAVFKLNADTTVLTKGNVVDSDEYSILQNAVNGPKLLEIIEKNNIGEIHIAGLCGDYCVGNTIKDLVEKSHAKKIKVMTEYIGNIDDGKTLKDIIVSSNLQTF